MRFIHKLRAPAAYPRFDPLNMERQQLSLLRLPFLPGHHSNAKLAVRQKFYIQ
ncbi:MAG: hypothetical protein ACI9JM_002190 [Halioglobus sp.]|jgi:hypothetical protein